MKNQKKKSFFRRVFLCLLAVLLTVCVAFGVYVSDYYHTDPAAEDALVSDDTVRRRATARLLSPPRNSNSRQRMHWRRG